MHAPSSHQWLKKKKKKKLYHKTPKHLDTRKIYCNNPKIWLLWSFHREMCPNDADGMANSVDPDENAPEQSDLVNNVCSDLSVRQFRKVLVEKIKLLHFLSLFDLISLISVSFSIVIFVIIIGYAASHTKKSDGMYGESTELVRVGGWRRGLFTVQQALNVFTYLILEALTQASMYMLLC